jgi:hypothetical protein
MDKGKNRRHGKIVPGGHTTRVEGLNRFLTVLERWPEISLIRLGQIEPRSTRSGGGFSFKATRPEVVGSRVVGIRCAATYGTNVQKVVLQGPDLSALKEKLHAEGYGADW